MEWFDNSALTLAVFLPLLGAVAVAVLPREREGLVRWAARLRRARPAGRGGHAGPFRLQAGAAMQFEVARSWIPAIGAGYHVGVDGIALPLLVLSLLLSALCVVYSFRSCRAPQPQGLPGPAAPAGDGHERHLRGPRPGAVLRLLGDGAHPHVLHDRRLGWPRRDYASIKFILYTLIGSVVMLLGFLALWLRSSPEAAGRTFDILALQEVGAARFGGTFGTIVFAAVAPRFAVKVPVWPLHTWLPDAHTEAPTVGSVLLAGILLKMGTYGFVRIALPVLPGAAHQWAPAIGVLGAIAIIYGALCCLAQRDVKRLIAYSRSATWAS